MSENLLRNKNLNNLNKEDSYKLSNPWKVCFQPTSKLLLVSREQTTIYRKLSCFINKTKQKSEINLLQKAMKCWQRCQKKIIRMWQFSASLCLKTLHCILANSQENSNFIIPIFIISIFWKFLVFPCFFMYFIQY